MLLSFAEAFLLGSCQQRCAANGWITVAAE
jgi:hypothetical protein